MSSQRRSFGVWIVLAAAFVVPLACLGTYYIYLAELVAILSIATIGLRQFVAFTNQLAFSQGAMMAIGAYSTAILSTSTLSLQGPGGVVGALALGAIAGVAASALVGAVVVYPALRLRGPYFAMVTIAFGWIIWRIIIEWVPVTGGDLGISAIPNLAAPMGLPAQAQYLLSIAFLALAGAFTGRVASSAFGVLQAAYRADPVALSALGVRAPMVKLLLFVIGSAWGGVSGALFAMHQSFVNPNGFEIFDSVFLLIAVLVGGVRSSLGAIVGVAIIFVLPEFLHIFDTYRLSFYAVLLLVVLLVARNGIVPDTRAESWRRRPRRRGARQNAPNDALSQRRNLVIEDISKCFGSLRALDQVSLAAAGGSVAGIIGPNGSGKSTLLDVICGYVERDGGSVTLDGKELPRTGLDEIGRLQVLRTFQKIRNFDELTCRENILVARAATRFRDRSIGLLGAILARMTAEDDDAVGQMLEDFGLKSDAETLAANLSQGHRRLLEIARIMAAEPHVLLLDEPTSGLNDREIADIKRAVLGCKRRGLAVIVVDHNMEFISAVSDHVTALSAGKVIAKGDASAVLASPTVREAYTGSGGAGA